MTQRDVVRVATGVVIGAALVAAVGVALDCNPFDPTKKTEVTLSATGTSGACELGKSTQVRVGKSKPLSWEITNYCTDAAKTVSVGNFRRTREPVAGQGCAEAGSDFPFSSDSSEQARSIELKAATADGDGDIKPTKGRIKLKVKDRGQLDPGELTYYFDVCLGGVRQDPQLVIER